LPLFWRGKEDGLEEEDPNTANGNGSLPLLNGASSSQVLSMDIDGARSSSLGDGSSKASMQASMTVDGAAIGGGADFMLAARESTAMQHGPHVAGRGLFRPRASTPLVQDGPPNAVLPATRRSGGIGGVPPAIVPWALAFFGAAAGQVDVGPSAAAALLAVEAYLQAGPMLGDVVLDRGLGVASQQVPDPVAGLVIDSNTDAASPFRGGSVGGVSSLPPTPLLLSAVEASSSTPCSTCALLRHCALLCHRLLPLCLLRQLVPR
jgi:hypothetical protein